MTSRKGMNSISVCMVVKNEERLIGNSLNSVRELADEIIVVDTGSTDKTVGIAEEAGALVVHHEWNGSLGRARNAYMRIARGDWILVLDGDETIARSDIVTVRSLVGRRLFKGYCLAVRNYTDEHDLMWNWYPNDRRYPQEESLSSCPGWTKSQPLRLFRNFKGLKYTEGSSVHTSPIASLRRQPGRIENQDDVVIHHFQYLKGGSRFLSRKQRLRLKGEISHLKQFPNDSYTHLNVAKTLFAEKRDEEAIEFLSKAVALDASFHDAYQLWGMIELENGKLQSAEERLKQAIKINSNSADAWALLGVALVEDGRFTEAIRALKRAIRLRPQHLLAHNSLGVAYEEMGMHIQARHQYQTALKMHPRFGPARANLDRLMAAIVTNSSPRA